VGKYASTDPNHVFPNRPIPAAKAERAQTYHTVDPVTGCWISNYAVNRSNGYASLGWREDGRDIGTTVQRASYTHSYGPIPDGMVIDHICHNRPCVNPAHLRAIPRGENARRQGEGDFPLGQCPNGHPLSEYRKRVKGVSAGMSYCGACQRERNDRLSARLKAEREAAVRTRENAGSDE
jgi:hypothetical protein